MTCDVSPVAMFERIKLILAREVYKHPKLNFLVNNFMSRDIDSKHHMGARLAETMASNQSAVGPIFSSVLSQNVVNVVNRYSCGELLVELIRATKD